MADIKVKVPCLIETDVEKQSGTRVSLNIGSVNLMHDEQCSKNSSCTSYDE